MDNNNKTGTKQENNMEAVTIEEAMDKVGTGCFQYKVTLVGAVIILMSFISSNIMAFVLPVAQCDLHMNSEDKGMLTSIFFGGMLLTCHMWGFLSDTMGRRYILIRCLFVDGLLYFVTMLTPNFYIILCLRFINGITSCGGVVSVYAYVGEFQTSKFRSHSLMIASFFASFAYTIMPVVAWLILPGKWHFELYPGQIIRPWKLFYVLCGVPSLTAAILLCFLPESPKYLLAKGDNKKVLEVLQRMYMENHKKDSVFPINCIKLNERERVEKLGDNQNKVFAVFKLIWNQTIPLLKKPHRNNMILVLVIFFSILYCNNGMYVWLPAAINKMKMYENGTGQRDGSFCDVLKYKENQFSLEYNKNVHYENTANSNPVYSNKINFTSNKLEEIEICNDEVDTSVYFIYLLLGSCLSITLTVITIANKFLNRKYLMMASSIISVLSLISLKISNDVITVPIKAGISTIASGMIYPMINSVVVDLFPTNLGAMAGCLAYFTCRIGSVTTHTISGMLIDSHCDIMLWIFIAIMTVNLLAVSLLPLKPQAINDKQVKNINEEA